MTTTAQPAAAAEAAPTLAPSGLVGGIGGLAFVALVVAQNALRAGFPKPDAGAVEVAGYYAAHRGGTTILTALFPLGALGLTVFLAAVATRVARGPGRAAGIAGTIAGVGIAATYTMVMATDLALAEFVHHGPTSGRSDVVDALWVLHNAVFAVLLVWLGIALAGLTAASAASGLLAVGWRAVGLLGGLALLVTGGAALGVLGGSPVLFVGLLGFLVWLVFVGRLSVVLLRDRTS